MNTNEPSADPIPGKEQPKKYIRTFEGDMATVKDGRIPELAPFTEVHPAVPEPSHDTPSPATPTLAPLKVIIPPPPPPIPAPSPVPLPESEPEPEPEPAPEPAPPEPVPLPEPVKPSQIETYAGDFSDRMKETHASPVTVLAAEQDSAPRTPPAVQKNAPRSYTWLYVLIGVVLVVAGGAGVYFTYARYLANRAPVVIAPAIPTPIFVDERAQVSGTGSVLLQAIEQSVALPMHGTVRLLYLTDATTTENNVFLTLGLPAPDILLRNVNAGGGMAGVINVDGTQSPFFILSVASYSDTFAGMLSWERTMPEALSGLFPPSPLSEASTSAATSTTQTASPQFRDEIVANHDVRVYRSPTGQSTMLYGYWNQTTLIIARDTQAFAAILDRLATSRTP